MPAIAGKSGLLKISANTMSEVTNWSLDASADMLESTSLGDSWKENTPGLKEWSASCDISWMMTDAAQLACQTAYLASTSVAVSLYVNATNFYSGTAYISSMNVEDAVDGLVTATLELTGSGALAYS